MNAIRESLDKIQATDALKENTMQYLMKRQEKQSVLMRRPTFKYACAVLFLLLFLGTGGYSVYRQPVSYISIDVNPSVELGINRFGRVVSADAYNEDGQALLQNLSLKNIPYIQAVETLLADEISSGFLKEDSLLVFTVISAQYASIAETLKASGFSQNYETLIYTGDAGCMEEAHSHCMSFGKYRIYQELTQYDSSVTIEDCHGMTMEEIHNRLESCPGHQGGHHGTPQTVTPVQTAAPKPGNSGHHGNHHR